MADVAATPSDQGSAVSPKQLLALLGLAAVVGLVVSLAAWCFLQGTHQIQHGIYTSLPHDLGYDHVPLWWSLPFCGLAGLITAFAIVRLPGRGGHVPAEGLKVSPTQPIELPGVVLAATAALGLGIVLGPEAPLIAIGGGLATYLIRLARRDVPQQVESVIAASGAFAALSFIFESPLIAAVILVEATAIGGPQQRMLLLPGMLAAGIGSLVSLGMGSWTGLSTSDYALSALPLPHFVRPDFVDFLWTIPLAVVIAVGAFVIMRLARELLKLVESREFVALPLAGLAVSGLAIAFSQAADKPVDQVLFSGESAVGGLVAGAGTWSVWALVLLIFFKGLAWAISLAGFRGGPVFPALFLGTAAGIIGSHLAGFAITPAVAVGMGAAVVSILGLPLSAVVLAALLTANSGSGATPLLIVGVVVAYLTTRALSKAADDRAKVGAPEQPAPVAADAAAGRV
jgi:H+/Cl- antiporter ClcA